MSYDESIAVFAPDGRLKQVEYAQRSTENSSLVTFGISEDSHAIVAIEKRSLGPNSISRQFIFALDHCESSDFDFSAPKNFLIFVGLAADSCAILKHARLFFANSRLKNGESPSIQEIAEEIGCFKHSYTIVGGKRPFGVWTLLVNFETAFVIDSNGNHYETKLGSVGNKNEHAIELLSEMSGSVEKKCFDAVEQTLQCGAKNIALYKIYKDRIEEIEK